MPFTRLDMSVPLGQLKQDIDALKPLQEVTWVPHVNREGYSGEWDVLTLRCPATHAEAHPILQGFALEAEDDWVNLPVLHHLPAISAVLRQFHCPLKSVRLMRLHPGARILPHRDRGVGIEFGEARLHIPIETSDQMEFWVDEKRIPMQEGEVWYLNADLVHHVCNKGDRPRINLVIDCVVNDWLLQRMSSQRTPSQQTSLPRIPTPSKPQQKQATVLRNEHKIKSGSDY